MRNVAVLFGGPSLEHEISLRSGRQVLDELDRARYRPVPVRIGRDRRWEVDGREVGDALEGVAALRKLDCEVCFLALHGPFGEDGTIQGFLDTVGLAYTGSGLSGSAHARDKIRAKRLLGAHGLPGAPDLVVPPADAATVRRELGFPVVVKNPFQGSTLGLALARDEEEFRNAVRELAGGCDRLLVERRELGREFTGAILEEPDGRPRSLPLVEIRTPGGWFDFEAKYTEGGAEEIVPAALDERTASTLRAAALDAHRILGLSGMSRTDMILRPDRSFVILETNTIPGLTSNSLLPKAAAAAGISFAEVLTRLVENALRGVRARG